MAQQFGAQVRPPQGDGFLAIFGVPVVRDDDPLRSVAAAESMHAALDHDNPYGIGLHIGICTGEVLVDGSAVGGLTGWAVNLAARLNDAAGPGETLVDESCSQLCEADAVFGPVQVLDLQGFPQPVAARLLVSSTGGGLAPVRPALGRSVELNVLTSAWDAVKGSGTSRLVVVRGEPGIGKSTLVRSWLDATPGAAHVIGACRDFGSSRPASALTEAVLALGDGSAAGLSSLLDAGARQAAVQLASLLPDDLQRTAGHREDDGTVGHLLELVLCGAARPDGLVVVLEDVHWSDQALETILEELAVRAWPAPILFLATSRALEARGEAAVSLLPLEAGDVQSLVELVCGGRPDDGLTAALVERSGGNPLWLQESCRLLQARGLLDVTDGRLHVADETALALLPASVRLVVTAQVDALPDEEKELLLAASVCPDGADPEQLMTSPSSRRAVDSLIDKGFLAPLGPGGVRFAHGLVRDAVYASLPKARRSVEHDRWVRTTGDAAARSYHAAQALRSLVGASHPDRGRFAERALGEAVALSETLRSVHSASAAQSLERVVDLTDLADVPGPAAELLTALAELMVDLEDVRQARVHAGRAVDLARAADSEAVLWRAELVLSRSERIAGNVDASRALAEGVLRSAEQRGDDVFLGRAGLALGETYGYEDLDRYMRCAAESYEPLRRGGDHAGSAEVARRMAWLLSVTGGPAFDMWWQRATEATSGDHARGQASLARTAAMAGQARKDWGASAWQARKTLDYAEPLGLVDMAVWAQTLIVEAAAELGDEELFDSTRTAMDRAIATGRPRQRIGALCAQLPGLVQFGQPGRAMSVMAEAQALLPELGASERALVAHTEGVLATLQGGWRVAAVAYQSCEDEAAALGWDLYVLGARLGRLQADERLGHPVDDALLELADGFAGLGAEPAARQARASAGRPDSGAALTLTEQAWSDEARAAHDGDWARAAQSWARLGLSASQALCWERAGDQVRADEVWARLRPP